MKMYVSRPTKASPFYRLNKPLTILIEHKEFKDGEELQYEDKEFLSGNYGEKEVDLTEEEIESCAKTTVDFLQTQALLAELFHGKFDYMQHQSLDI